MEKAPGLTYRSLACHRVVGPLAVREAEMMLANFQIQLSRQAVSSAEFEELMCIREKLREMAAFVNVSVIRDLDRMIDVTPSNLIDIKDVMPACFAHFDFSGFSEFVLQDFGLVVLLYFFSI